VTIETPLKRNGNGDFVKLNKSSYDGDIEVVRHARDECYASDDSGPDDVEALDEQSPKQLNGAGF
jgi:hypothetical protein